MPYWHIDTGFAGLLMLLTAVDEGLGACFFGIPPEQTDATGRRSACRRSTRPIGAVSLGYRAADHRSRRSPGAAARVDEVVHRGPGVGERAERRRRRRVRVTSRDGR